MRSEDKQELCCRGKQQHLGVGGREAEMHVAAKAQPFHQNQLQAKEPGVNRWKTETEKKDMVETHKGASKHLNQDSGQNKKQK